jgi:hypothetical protein
MLAIRKKYIIKNNKVAIKLPDGYNEKQAEVIILIPNEENIMLKKKGNTDKNIIPPCHQKKQARLPNLQLKGKSLSSEVIKDRR